MEFKTKDSGKKKSFQSGAYRDIEGNKSAFILTLPKGMPYDKTMLYRWGKLMARGAEKYGRRNWEKANSEEELERFKSSAFRHLMQFLCGVDDGEDHAAAVMFNLNAHETTKWKIKNG